uniref:Nyctalopin n=1 Tax=Eptatretus burgeri TaxID=7764 RepID=A0A8C4X1G7_EPTBU
MSSTTQYSRNVSWTLMRPLEHFYPSVSAVWHHTLVSAVSMTTGERADGGNPTACASKSTCPARCQCDTGEQHEEEASISCERAGLMSVPHDVPCDVRSMFLRGNALRMLPPGALPPLLFLRRLSLAHNNLTFIAPDAFQGVPALLWLSLSHNIDLGILHARALSGLQVLQTLILAACRLHDLPQRLFAPTHGLTHLHLWDNRLRRIPGALRILSRLTHLYLEDNAIEVVASSSLLGLENLTLLDLQDNYISVIHEEAFISCNKLTSLNLANNHLLSLPANAFHGLNQLQVLNLGGNQLLEVPQACLFGLVSLHTLHLEHNRVKEFPLAVYDALPLLHTLHLQGNWLSSLSPPNSITATALRTLYLFDNPWHCDC